MVDRNQNLIFCENETRFEVLNTAELAEVCLIFAKFQNLVTLAFCTLFAMIQKKGCHEILILVTFTLTLGIY